MVGGGEGGLYLFKSGTATDPLRLGTHPGGVLAVSWQRSGQALASSGQDGRVQLWDARTGQSRELMRERSWSPRLAFSDNGRFLAVICARTLRVFDQTGAAVELSNPDTAVHASTLNALAWRPKALELVVAGVGGLRLHRLGRTPAVEDFALAGASVELAWTAEGRHIAIGQQDGNVMICNAATASVTPLGAMDARIIAVADAPSGRHLAAASGARLAIWDVSARDPAGKRPLLLESHSEAVSALQFRPTGAWLVSGGRDRRLLLWRVGSDNATDAQLLADECTLVRFSPDGRWLLAGDARGGITLFEFEG